MSIASNSPATLSLAQKRQLRQITLCRDCYEGPLRIQDQGPEYLPQFPRESNDTYKTRLEASTFYDAYSRTVNGLTGLIFRDPPKLNEKLPQQLLEIWENVDLQGTHGEVFCQNRHTDGEIDGLYAILVDMPPAMDTIDEEVTREDTKDRRPYWVPINASNIIAGAFSFEDGKLQLTHFRFMETVVNREGFEEIEVQRIREFNLAEDEDGTFVEFIIYERDPDKTDEWSQVKSSWMDIDEIPIAFAYVGGYVGPLESRPPHYALARENIKHYQLTSDNDNVLHLTCVPIYVRIGYIAPAGQRTDSVGPTVGIDLPINGDAKYVEPQGSGLVAMKDRIEKSEQRMAILGLSMLMSETRAAETATSKRITKAESDSALSSHARASQDCFEEAIRLTAKWMTLEEQLPDRDEETRWISVNRNFDDLTLDPQIVTILADLVKNNKLTQETLWKVLLRGRVLPETFSPDQEAKILEKKGLDEIARAMEQMKAASATQPGMQAGSEDDEEDDSGTMMKKGAANAGQGRRNGTEEGAVR